MGQHINAMKAGSFDGGYTLEPNATVMNQLGFAKTVEAGVIAKYVLGDPEADPFAAGCALVLGLHQQTARRRQALRAGLGQGPCCDRGRSARGAQASSSKTP